MITIMSAHLPLQCSLPVLQYPHVAAVYHSMYRLARYGAPSAIKRATWQWYLKQAVGALFIPRSHIAGMGRDCMQGFVIPVW